MNDEDLITAEEIIDDDFGDLTPLIGICRDNSDGSFMFETTLSNPRQVLWVLRAIENKVLEDCFG